MYTPICAIASVFLAVGLLIYLTTEKMLDGPFAFFVSLGAFVVIFILLSLVFRTISPGEIWRNLPDKPSRK
ncbi:MAG: hypothetical protein HYY60_01885 [Parcubacteria group bacterium]|nr:hypothetical protein [Parcubacteria group bacterium]